MDYQGSRWTDIEGCSFSFRDTTPTTPAQVTGRDRYQGGSMSDLSEFTPVNASVLGRRKRTESLHEWSPPTKAHLRTYAAEIAGEFGVAENDREEFVNASMLPTHKLVIVTLAAILGAREDDSSDTKLQGYVGSAEFKDHVVGHIRGVLLDPKLPSYKTGFLDRLMRHIRLNPSVYRIPQEFQSMITTRVFQGAVSKAATGARSEMKRKLIAAWKAKSSIYELVKSLAWKSSQEMTDAIWARFAWVQMKLVDYKAQGGKDEGFWDSIDQELADRRAKALTIPLPDRPAFTSYIFEESLKQHLRLCQRKKKRMKSSTQLPQWQQDISRAVAEMETYTLEQLAEEEVPEEGDGEGGGGGGGEQPIM
ncbi:hypothetical protein B0H15DRAFT_807272 [Mycena belliarum]|uniref:Uncharacterized protein n=1 Tax=Mycena belliarum TaxID=1033014 RepID=A0AAD6XI20_9AGAR|nr:hypothetical protein B0H15DRAFT_807272 [Mycena belliae]